MKKKNSDLYLTLNPFDYYELIIGKLPTKVYDYVAKKYDGDLRAYLYATEKNEVPKKYQWIAGRDLLDCQDDIEHSDLPTDLEIHVKKHSDPSYDYLVPLKDMWSRRSQTIDKHVSQEKFFDDGETHFFVWQAAENGESYIDLEIDDKEFDLKKLTVYTRVLEVEGKYTSEEFIESIEYGDAYMDFEPPEESSLDGPEVEIY